MKIINEFKIEKRGDKWIVVGHQGRTVGTHPSEEKAKAQIAAIYANEIKESSRFKEAGKYSMPQLQQNLSTIFKYMIYSQFENDARTNFLSNDTMKNRQMLRNNATREKFFTSILDSLMRVSKNALADAFTSWYGPENIDKKSFDKYYNNATGTSASATPPAPVARRATVKKGTAGVSGTGEQTAGITAGGEVDKEQPSYPSNQKTNVTPALPTEGTTGQKVSNKAQGATDLPQMDRPPNNLPLITSKDIPTFQKDWQAILKNKKIKVGSYTYGNTSIPVLTQVPDPQVPQELVDRLHQQGYTIQGVKPQQTKQGDYAISLFLGQTKQEKGRNAMNRLNKKYIEELDDFDPEEKDWLMKQIDQIEKENAEMDLPKPATDTEKTKALKPIDSREQQEEGDDFIEAKTKTIKGFKSPEPGKKKLTKKGKNTLAKTYAGVRGKQKKATPKNKAKAAKIAWSVAKKTK